MGRCTHGVGMVAVALIALAAGQAIDSGNAAWASQPPADKKAPPPADKKGAQPEKKPADKKGGPEMAMPETKPGPEHKVLEAMVGDWEGSVKMWMAPGAPPMESTGKIHREMALDGMFLTEHVDGASMVPGGKPFKGMGTVGYNQNEKRYESTWIENMSSGIMFDTGKYDEAKKTFTWEGEGYDPMAKKRVRHRGTVDCSNPDRQVMKSYTPGPDGKETLVFEGTFERKKK